MTAEAVFDELRRRPFRPLRFQLNDGRSVDLRRPEMALVTGREVYIGEETKPGSGVAHHVELISLSSIVRVDKIA